MMFSPHNTRDEPSKHHWSSSTRVFQMPLILMTSLGQYLRISGICQMYIGKWAVGAWLIVAVWSTTTIRERSLTIITSSNTIIGDLHLMEKQQGSLRLDSATYRDCRKSAPIRWYIEGEPLMLNNMRVVVLHSRRINRSWRAKEM